VGDAVDSAAAFGSIEETASGYRDGRLAPTRVTRLLLDRIERLDSALHGYVTVAGDRALADAEAAERRLSAGDAGRLVGIPFAVKDSIATRGIRTTSNSRVLEHWIPAHDAAAVARLRNAGAVILGKTNLNEFGWSLPSPDDLCPPPRNPWNPQYAAVGSSSGSGVVVCAGLAIAALGTDGGGSARLPAGQMGLIGLKPTHALISRARSLHRGTLSEIGPITRTARDAAIVLDALAGYDSDDPDSAPRRPGEHLAGIDEGMRGVRLGVPRRYLDGVPVEDEIRDAFETALRECARLGASVHDVDLRALDHGRAANFVVLNAEHYAMQEATLRAEWDRHGRSARLYLTQAAFLSAADYLYALEVRDLVGAVVDDALRDLDAIVMPTSPVVTAEAARQPGAHRKGVNASFTAPFNLTGHPAVSVPCGMSATGLPMGLQLAGRRYGEALLLRIAHAYERATAWHMLRPARFAPAPTA
jgi:aspartyl-tRNA(Asn)/glutamyl-tRNA(Gln) amidotransferase subunit A